MLIPLDGHGAPQRDITTRNGDPQQGCSTMYNQMVYYMTTRGLGTGTRMSALGLQVGALGLVVLPDDASMVGLTGRTV